MSSSEDGAAAGGPSPRARPIVFGTAQRPLLGMFHAARGVARPLGVVLCNPLGHEALCAHRTYRHLAELLAARGFPALRFDYDGTGDSWGVPEDPGQLDAWVRSTRAAIAEIRARAGVAQVSLFGVRFGVAIALLAAQGQSDVESLIAWAPPRSGAAFVRELRAYKMIRDPRIPLEPRTDGSEEVVGYLFARETLEEMARVDLAALATAEAPKRALVLPRLAKPVDEAPLLEALQKRGAEARILAGATYAQMMRDPFLSLPPPATLAAIADWLAEPPARIAVEPPPPQAPSASAEPARAQQQIERFEANGLRETPLIFGDGDRLFGVLTEPLRPVSERPAILLLNVGSDQHVGPHRMYVDFARDLAALGYSAFRFDIGGLGESAPVPGRPENRLYDARSAGDVLAAIDHLQQTRGTKRFVLAGLCAGAFLAYQAALRDPRAVGQVLINSFAFEWKEGDPVEPGSREVTAQFGSARHYSRALLDPEVWGRAVKGKIDWRAVSAFAADYARHRTRSAVHGLRARLRGGVPADPVERGFLALSDRGVESLLISGFDDGGLDMIERHLGEGVSRMRGRKNFALEIVEKIDHTFTPISSRLRLRDLFFHYLARHFP